MEWKNEDERAKFANKVCLLQVKHYCYDFYEAADNLEDIYQMFDENVRNIYELIDTQIPLFVLYELIHLDKDDWLLEVLKITKQEAIDQVILDCISFYK